MNYDPNVMYIQQLDKHFDLRPAKEDDAGMDLPVRVNGVKVTPDVIHTVDGKDRSLWIYEDHFFIPAGGRAEIPTGLRIKVPDDCWGNIKPRSSTGWKKELDVFEAVLDPGYTGACFVLVENDTAVPVKIKDGDRLAQLVLVPKRPTPKIETVAEMPNTARGQSGFGSTGN